MLHLHSNLGVMSMDSRTLDVSSFLAVIPVNVGHLDTLSYRGNELFQITDSVIKTLEFWFTDGLGRLTDFQGAHWSLCLAISVIPTPPSTIPKNILSKQTPNNIHHGVPSLDEKKGKHHNSQNEKSRDNRPHLREKDSTRGHRRRKNG